MKWVFCLLIGNLALHLVCIILWATEDKSRCPGHINKPYIRRRACFHLEAVTMLFQERVLGKILLAISFFFFWKDTCTLTFIIAWLTIAKVWKQARYPSRDEWIRAALQPNHHLPAYLTRSPCLDPQIPALYLQPPQGSQATPWCPHSLCQRSTKEQVGILVLQLFFLLLHLFFLLLGRHRLQPLDQESSMWEKFPLEEEAQDHFYLSCRSALIIGLVQRRS